jgi:type IV pilus assembly protein PilC
MPVFAYKAMNPGGRTVRGELDAINLVDLEMRLKRMDLDFVNGQALRRGGVFQGAPIGRRDLINFCFHMEQLTRSGVPILDALADLRDSTEQPRLREIIASVIESIEGGRTLSQAMGEHPKIFDAVFCSLIRAGESTGNLPDVLLNISESLKRDDELSAYSKRLIIYPAIVSLVIFAALGVSMVFVVPELAKLFQSFGRQLPLHTRIMIAVSNFVARFWPAILLTIAGVAIGLKVAVSTHPEARFKFDEIKLRLPLVGPILRKIILARFAGTFAMMYSSGIAIIDAIRASEDIAGNAVLREGLHRVGNLISEGQNVSTAFQNTGLFPPLVLRMLRVGENTGALDSAMMNVTYFYNRDVRESIEKALAVVPSVLVVLLGGLLLIVIVSVLGPVYDVIIRLPT